MSGGLTNLGLTNLGAGFGGFGGGQPVCVLGRVNLLVFIAGPSAAIFPPISGGVVAQVTTLSGATIPLLHTRQQPFGTTLGAVDNQFAIVCGVPALTGTGQLGLDVTSIIPLGTGTGTGTGAAGTSGFGTGFGGGFSI